jgi:hypothetical protein
VGRQAATSGLETTGHSGGAPTGTPKCCQQVKCPKLASQQDYCGHRCNHDDDDTIIVVLLP